MAHSGDACVANQLAKIANWRGAIVGSGEVRGKRCCKRCHEAGNAGAWRGAERVESVVRRRQGRGTGGKRALGDVENRWRVRTGSGNGRNGRGSTRGTHLEKMPRSRQSGLARGTLGRDTPTMRPTRRVRISRDSLTFHQAQRPSARRDIRLMPRWESVNGRHESPPGRVRPRSADKYAARTACFLLCWNAVLGGLITLHVMWRRHVECARTDHGQILVRTLRGW
ncbi:hypothetical protein AMAG_18763 [Allomyces macrogynus ATCC 38327]|uniref:Uncharacterized protein n=1 Tax=Allomyces macrogynus (strain ATCC 38327) TaxID=578462 RepID=A0A0L0SFJ8_ALLM3|nr:hypothetical protein AMAG_18763 [Allomyces macrogynus ATCC 38327]|eukprot:KNE61298.1 hypothetical protein AMAG_18763 [Allomyces macrogynus ATCC 38327]